MIRAIAAQPPFDWIYGDRVEWIGINPVVVNETAYGIQKTLIDPRTVEEVEEKEWLSHIKENPRYSD